jgi:4-amino-4-deoxy-L-arabinose transferase-like glycosyltransferase
MGACNKYPLIYIFKPLINALMLQFLKVRWELLVILVIFIMVRIPALHYPFYWDESWSYAPGVKLMYLHGPSLMPNAIDLFYSRGHPLLFYASAAAWMRVFGDSHVAQHAFSLFISVALLIAVYEAGLRLFGRKVAVIATLLIPLQVMFYVQATFLLPEVMIALLTVLTLYFYSKGNYVLTFIFCSALLLTKESSIALAALLGVHSAINLLNKKQALRTRIKGFTALLLAGLVILGFYLLQKKLNGWYFFPQHTGLMVWEWHAFWDKFRYSLDTLLSFNYKYRVYQLLMVLCVAAALRCRDIGYAVPLLPAWLIHAAINDKLGWIPRKLLFVLILCSFVITAFQWVRLSVNKKESSKKLMYLGTFFFLLYLLFSSVNFFTPRYLITDLAVISLLCGAWFELVLPTRKIYYYLVPASIVLAGAYGFYKDTGLGDTSLGAFDGMTVEQRVVDYLERNGYYNKNIAAASFQTREHLTKPFTGFLSGTKTFASAVWDITPSTDLVIFDNIEPDDRYEQFKKDTAWHLVYRTDKGQAWQEIYARKGFK